MSKLVCDDRITSIERIDRPRCVLADAHSMGVVANELSSKQVPFLTARQFVETPGGPWLSHIIQTVVLYDTILVDSVLFDLDEVTTAHELFPDLIKGLFIRDSVRNIIGERIDGVISKGMNLPTEMNEQDRNRWLQLDSSEKPLMDKISERPPRLIPPEYASDPEILRTLDRSKPIWSGIPSPLLNSDMTVARAHFYLELGRELRVPLNIDPVRSVYLGSILRKGDESKYITTIQTQLVQSFVEKITSGEEDTPIVFDVRIPPVADLVLQYAKLYQISLHEATIQVRNSKNALEFRKWSSELFSLREQGGIKAFLEYKKMMKAFNDACEKWTIDVSEHVNYITRKIKFGDIPLVGKVLAAVSMDTFELKDPIIRPELNYRYFLFLNDLLRDPVPIRA